jgi:acylpyruvate hydrolase
VRLVTFARDGVAVPGLRDGDSVVDLTRAAPGLAGDWAGILATGALQEALVRAATTGPEARLPAAGLTWLPPIPRPPKILCIGLNYRSHAEELGMAIPEHPIVFARWPASLVGH